MVQLSIKLFFEPGTFQKSLEKPGKADFRRKNCISWISWVLRIFLRPKMLEICRKSWFWGFSQDFTISFFGFFAQRCILGLLKPCPSLIFEKNFFLGQKYWKYTGNRNFCRFSSDFFLIFLCLFTQTLSITMSTNWFMLPELSKNPPNSRFSPEKWRFWNFTSCTLYFFIEFCTLIRNGNAQKVTEPDFVKTFFLSENARNMPGKLAFGHFLEISLLVFSHFLLKDAS